MVVNNKKLIRTMKIVLSVLITAAVVFGATVALYLKSIKDDPTKVFGAQADFSVTDDAGNQHDYNQGIVSFVIVGLDSSQEREQKNQGYRSDVIMVCVVDTNNQQASIISIPRDTKARVQVLNAAGKPTRMISTKINAAFSYGFSPDKYGYENTLAAVNDLFNSSGVKINPITAYIGADMDDFVTAADLIGGVDLKLPHNVPGFGSQGETIHLAGEKALDYVRIRSGKGLSGMDTDRTERQRGFIRAMAGKMQDEGALKTVPKIYNDCVKEGIIKTNLTLEQMYAVAKSLEGIYLDDVNFTMLPGYTVETDGDWHVNMSKLKTLVLDIFYNSASGDAPYISEPFTNTPTRQGGGTVKQYDYTTKKRTTPTSGKTKSTTEDKPKTTTARPTKESTKPTTTKATTKATTTGTKEPADDNNTVNGND